MRALCANSESYTGQLAPVYNALPVHQSRICACDWRATCPALVKNYMKTRPGLGLHLTMDSSCFLLRQLEIYGGSLCEPPSADMLIMFMRYEAKQTQFITHCQHHHVDTTISTSNHWVDHLVDYSTESRDELVP